jgi:hypothetical protein
MFYNQVLPHIVPPRAHYAARREIAVLGNWLGSARVFRAWTKQSWPSISGAGVARDENAPTEAGGCTIDADRMAKRKSW